MRYLSLFSGIGTGEKGIEQAFNIHGAGAGQGLRAQAVSDSGVLAVRESGQSAIGRHDSDNGNGGGYGMPECIGYAEIDKYASAIYRHHWPGAVNYGDATELVCDTLPDFDFLIAGFPCQAFSIAGKRQGFNEARGTLFFEIARILSHKRPGHFLLENVGGLRSHDGGKTMQRILGILSDIGYFVEVPLLNSKDYGVPQNRERVFFIGHLAERCEREILSFGRHDREVIELSGQPSNCLTARYYGAQAVGTYIVERELDAQEVRICGQSDSNGFSPDFNELSEHEWESSCRDGTENAAGNRQIRRLTPIECERLQGLPDDFTKYGLFGGKVIEISDTQRYKTCGNAMTTFVIEAIVSRMIEKGCLTVAP